MDRIYGDDIILGTMGNTITEKIIERHLVSGEMKTGAEIGIRIDQTLTQDATGTMAYLEFEAMGLGRVKTQVSVSYVDHNTMQEDFRNMDDHVYLQTAAKKYGVRFSRPGNGICHQLHLERFSIPGSTLLGSDSHTPTSGGMGMLAIGSGGLDVAVAMGGGPFYVAMPAVVGVKLTGRLKSMVSAKDVILTLLGRETVKGGVGSVYEYFGPGVATLSIPERATITNMGAELGATTSIFPADEVAREFLYRQGRGSVFTALSADPDANYARVIEIDLDAVVPMAALPHSPDNVKPVSEIAGRKLDQVAIGSCTNSSVNDIGIAADIVGTGTIADNVSCAVSFGSRQVMRAAAASGLLDKLIGSGCRVLESACGPCIGMGFAPKSGGVSLRTFNRNFKGRSGTEDAEVYLVSPETAAASALRGVITDPRDLRMEKKDYSGFMVPSDTLIVEPASEAEASSVEVVRGPNIKPCPVGKPLADSLSGPALLKLGDGITTDHIMPAGAKILPLRSNVPEIAKHAFEYVDKSFPERALAAGSGFIVAGANYGQGSSREHAALAPMYLGIRAVIVKSFARIHRANLINFGILPLEFADPTDYDRISQGDEIVLASVKTALGENTRIKAEDRTAGFSFVLSARLDPRAVRILIAGGLLPYTREGGK
jgi:aconitate hydratase